jgi:hypothetical protein
MTAVLAIACGLLGVGHAIWPFLSGRRLPPLEDESAEYDDGFEEARAIRAWSVAAGETSSELLPPVSPRISRESEG